VTQQMKEVDVREKARYPEKGGEFIRYSVGRLKAVRGAPVRQKC